MLSKCIIHIFAIETHNVYVSDVALSDCWYWTTHNSNICSIILALAFHGCQTQLNLWQTKNNCHEHQHTWNACPPWCRVCHSGNSKCNVKLHQIRDNSCMACGQTLIPILLNTCTHTPSLHFGWLASYKFWSIRGDDKCTVQIRWMLLT